MTISGLIRSVNLAHVQDVALPESQSSSKKGNQSESESKGMESVAESTNPSTTKETIQKDLDNFLKNWDFDRPMSPLRRKQETKNFKLALKGFWLAHGVKQNLT